MSTWVCLLKFAYVKVSRQGEIEKAASALPVLTTFDFGLDEPLYFLIQPLST